MYALKLFSLLTILIQINAQNYCARELCRGRRHIACNNRGNWAPGCNGRLLNIRPHINLILQLHNECRNRIAAGRLSRFPSAVQMATMSWDPELARLAAFNALRCRMQHDQCRNTNAFRFAGQNLGIIYTRNISSGGAVRRIIESWASEHRFANRNDVQRFRPRGGPQIGHFTAMVNERNNRIGCAISQFTTSRRVQATYLVCNYAVTNVINNPVYRFGPSGSQCRSGRNRRYRSLCSPRERYNHNQWRG